MHTFVDSFQGCYKDGTQPGTRDCRWFASLLFLSRLVLLCIGAFTLNSTYFSLAAIILVVVAILFIVVEPFKINESNSTDTNAIFILLLALWYVSLSGIKEADAKEPQVANLFRHSRVDGSIASPLHICHYPALDEQEKEVWVRGRPQTSSLEAWLQYTK